MSTLLTSLNQILVTAPKDPPPLIDAAGRNKVTVSDTPPVLSFNTRDPGYNNLVLLAGLGLIFYFRKRIFL